MIRSQPEIQTVNRRKNLTRIRRSKRYRDTVAEKTAGACCVECGRTDHLTIHHESENDYKDDETYFRSLSRGKVMCVSCHFAYHKGLKLCPVCKKNYCPEDSDCCYDCLSEDEKFRIEQSKRDAKKLQRKLREDQKARVKAWKDAHAEASG